jgi:hypothetical protein
MWSQTYSKTYKNIEKEDIWRIWSEVNSYVEWHDDLDSCKLEGEFEVGNYFKLKPKGAPTFKVHITELDYCKLFVDCTNFIGAKMYDIHKLEQTKNGLKITNTIKVTGILSFLWVKLVAKSVAESAKTEMDQTVKLARKQNEQIKLRV